MDKLLLDVFVPALGIRFDIVVMAKTRVSDICALLGKAVEEYSENKYISSGEEVLGSLNQNVILSPERYLSEYQIQNGDSLFFC